MRAKAAWLLLFTSGPCTALHGHRPVQYWGRNPASCRKATLNRPDSLLWTPWVWTVTNGCMNVDAGEIPLLTKWVKKVILKSPSSRGGSGTLNRQSAIAGVIFCRGFLAAKQPFISGDEAWVLRNRNLWTGSGQEWSSPKWMHLCAARAPGPS